MAAHQRENDLIIELLPILRPCYEKVPVLADSISSFSMSKPGYIITLVSLVLSPPDQDTYTLHLDYQSSLKHFL